uniref:Uncharacterized protein n=1 Tax=uncultured Nocardioidaceae bacterium TaxID=253824 RepID=A0A6J4MKI1_9ACTN|nr:MAG: hypothetical protein AVDCRST_MAG46-3389 [uncultured Nocardioidaceae bacterium]
MRVSETSLTLDHPHGDAAVDAVASRKSMAGDAATPTIGDVAAFRRGSL